LRMHRLGRRLLLGDARDEFVEDLAAGARDPLRRQVERRQIRPRQFREPHLTPPDDAEGRVSPPPPPAPPPSFPPPRPPPGFPPLQGGEGWGGGYSPQKLADLFEGRGVGEADRVMAAVIEPAVLDQADRRVDDRHQRLAACGAVEAAPGAQPLDILGAVAAFP